MPKPYSDDLRERVIAAVETESMSRREAARRYRVSAASAVKWLQRYRRTGGRSALPMGGDRRSVLKPRRDWLLALLAREPDLTLQRIAERLWSELGVRADPSMLCRFFQSEGISFKKKRSRGRAAPA